MLDEVWMEIEGYPNYAINNYGDVVNIKTDKMLRQRPNDNGYLRVALSHEGQVQDFYIHQLVAYTFFAAFEPGDQIAWVNGDITDNRPSNLRLKRKSQMAILDGMPARPQRQGSWGKRVKILETGEIFRTVRECAKHIKGDYSSIYSCLRGERKKHRGFTFEYFDW